MRFTSCDSSCAFASFLTFGINLLKIICSNFREWENRENGVLRRDN